MGSQPIMSFSNTEERAWPVIKYTELNGEQRMVAGGNLRAYISHHRRQLSVYQTGMLMNIPLHHSKVTVRCRGTAVVFRGKKSHFRLRFPSIGDRISFCATLSDLVPVLAENENSQDCCSQGMSQPSQGTSWKNEEPSSSSWQTPPLSQSSGQIHASSFSQPSTHGSAHGNGYGGGGIPTVYEGGGTRQLQSNSQGNQRWIETPPDSQPINPSSTERRQMQQSTWTTPLKRYGEDEMGSGGKRKKDEGNDVYNWESLMGDRAVPSSTCHDTSNDFSDSCSTNDSFTSSQPIQSHSYESILPPSSTVTCTQTDSVESVECGTQTEGGQWIEIAEETRLGAILNDLLNRPDFVALVESFSSCIEEDEELQDLMEKTFHEEEVEVEGDGQSDSDADSTQPLDWFPDDGDEKEQNQLQETV